MHTLTRALFEHFRDTKAFLFVEESEGRKKKDHLDYIIKGRRFSYCPKVFPRELHTFKLNDIDRLKNVAPVIGFYTDQMDGKIKLKTPTL
jgi:hypothetical protein